MTPVSTLKPSEVLAKAADLIEPEGAWTQGWLFRRSDGSDMAMLGCFPPPKPASCCAIGAMILAATNADSAAYTTARRLLAQSIGVNSRRELPEWNDAEGRTQAEVVAALRKASALAAEEGQ